MFKEGIYNVIGGGLKLVISFLTIPILLNYLGLSLYGFWVLIYSFVNILMIFDGGVGMSVTYFLSGKLQKPFSEESLREISTYLSSILLLLVALISVMILFFLITQNIIVFYLENKSIGLNIKNISHVVMFFLFTSIILIVQQLFNGLLQANLDYRFLNIQKTLSSIFLNSSLILNALLNKGIVGMACGLFSISIISLIVTIIYIRKYIPKGIYFVIEKKRFTEVSKYSTTVWGGFLGSLMFSQLDKVIAASVINIHELGIYSAITNMSAYINMISSTPIQSLTVHSSTANNNGDLQNIIKPKLEQSVELNIILASISSLGFMLLLGSSNQLHFSQQQYIVPFVVIIYFIYSLNSPGYFYLLGAGKVKVTTSVVLIGGSISLILIYILGVNFKLNGCLLGNIGFLVTIYLTYYALKSVNCNIKFNQLILKNTILLIFFGIVLSRNSSIILNFFIAILLIFFNLLFNHRTLIGSFYKKILQ
jgi:O-antigen/teichoic acid export membrane protein